MKKVLPSIIFTILGLIIIVLVSKFNFSVNLGAALLIIGFILIISAIKRKPFNFILKWIGELILISFNIILIRKNLFKLIIRCFTDFI